MRKFTTKATHGEQSSQLLPEGQGLSGPPLLSPLPGLQGRPVSKRRQLPGADRSSPTRETSSRPSLLCKLHVSISILQTTSVHRLAKVKSAVHCVVASCGREVYGLQQCEGTHRNRSRRDRVQPLPPAPQCCRLSPCSEEHQ